MAFLCPVSGEQLGAGGHLLMHQVVQVDDLAPSGAFRIRGDGAAVVTGGVFVGDALVGAHYFSKSLPGAVLFVVSGLSGLVTGSDLFVEVGGALLLVPAGSGVVMPSLTAGTDYAVWVAPDGGLGASLDFVVAPVVGARLVGGFHFAPGGHSGVPGGGNVTPQINPFSLWDLKWRPRALDPRGMVLVAGQFWCDIYLTGVEHVTNGTSKLGVVIADSSSPPKRPLAFGGNGTVVYSGFNMWEAGEVLLASGKRLPDFVEFAALAYGTTENSSRGADPVNTVWEAAFISKWGVCQATGNMQVWGMDAGSNMSGGWYNMVDGRGQVYNPAYSPFFGGHYGMSSYSGSRCVSGGNNPRYSGGAAVAARGVCDHVALV